MKPSQPPLSLQGISTNSPFRVKLLPQCPFLATHSGRNREDAASLAAPYACDLVRQFQRQYRLGGQRPAGTLCTATPRRLLVQRVRFPCLSLGLSCHWQFAENAPHNPIQKRIPTLGKPPADPIRVPYRTTSSGRYGPATYKFSRYLFPVSRSLSSSNEHPSSGP